MSPSATVYNGRHEPLTEMVPVPWIACGQVQACVFAPMCGRGRQAVIGIGKQPIRDLLRSCLVAPDVDVSVTGPVFQLDGNGLAQRFISLG